MQPIMKKSPLDMNYKELNNLLDSLLKAEGLPINIDYRSNTINYYKYNKLRTFFRVIPNIIKSKLFYNIYIKKRLGSFKNIESFEPYFWGAKCLLSDLLVRRGGKFDNKLFANYQIAAMLYDASCDIPSYRKYLKYLDAAIMSNKVINPYDEYLTLFKEATDYIKKALDRDIFDVFMNYMKIEHISQLMSIYQSSDKKISRDNLFKITLAKGGITVLAGIYIMLPDLSKKERKAIYEMAGVSQILEDVWDIAEDLEMGIKTLPNQGLISHQEFKLLYFGTVNNLIDKCNLDTNRSNIALDLLCSLFSGPYLYRR